MNKSNGEKRKLLSQNLVKSFGYLKKDGNNLRIITNNDFCKYYLWHFNRAYFFTIKMNTPRHGSHITVINESIHGVFDLSPLRELLNTKIYFEYDIEGNIGGFNRGFKNFWFPVICPQAEGMKRLVGIVDKAGYLGLHITIGNTKNLTNPTTRGII